MEYTPIPSTRSILCCKLSKVGPSGSVRALSQMRMRTVFARLSTFQRWIAGPRGSPSPLALSTAGFIFRGVSDHTQCFTCSVVVSHWLPEHDPVAEHRRHSPSCEFLNQQFSSLQQSSEATLTSAITSVEDVSSKANLTNVSLCKICYTQDMCYLFRPCGHLLTCASCADQLSNCPICRCRISEKIRAFVSFQ